MDDRYCESLQRHYRLLMTHITLTDDLIQQMAKEKILPETMIKDIQVLALTMTLSSQVNFIPNTFWEHIAFWGSFSFAYSNDFRYRLQVESASDALVARSASAARETCRVRVSSIRDNFIFSLV
jgi:hypothetical protein